MTTTVIRTGSSIVITATGQSAYEIAVENGFEGTEEEWVASLEDSNFPGEVVAPTNAFGTGDSVKPPSRAWQSIGAVSDIRQGTAAAPNLAYNPALKVSRTLKITDASWTSSGHTGAGDDEFAAISGCALGVDGNEVQSVGVYGYAENASLTNPPGSGTNADACGVFGKAVKSVAGQGYAMGGFFVGQRYYQEGGYNAIQLSALNWARDGALVGIPTVYDPNGSASCGIWLVPGGFADTAVGLQFGQPFGRQWEVGIAFNANNTGGKNGPVKVTSIRDDGGSVTSYQVNGSHTYAIDTRGATLSDAALIMAAGHAISWGDAGLKRSAAGKLQVTNGAGGTGTFDAITLGRIAQSGAQVDHTGNTTKTVLATIAVPAGAIGPNGSVDVDVFFTGTSNANTKTLGVDFGGTNMWTAPVTTNSAIRATVNIFSTNSVTAQKSLSSASATGPSTPAAILSSAVNTAASVNIEITGTLANAADTISLLHYLVRVNYGA